MSKTLSILIGAALLAVGTVSAAADSMKQGAGMKMDMKMMDMNSDGMVSKDEFMKYHEAMYDKMKKNKDGMVDMKDMGMMMQSGMKDEKMMKSGAMKDDKMMQGGMKDASKK